jgi:hypothetical protein
MATVREANSVKGIISSKTLISVSILNAPSYLGANYSTYRRKIPTALSLYTVNTKLDILDRMKIMEILLVEPMQDML